jgi:transposase-like protein
MEKAFNKDLTTYKKNLKQLVSNITKGKSTHQFNNTQYENEFKCYSIKDKLSIVKHYLESNSVQLTATKYSIQPSTLKKWIDMFNEDCPILPETDLSIDSPVPENDSLIDSPYSETSSEKDCNTNLGLNCHSNALNFLSDTYLTLPALKPGGSISYNEDERMAISYNSIMTTMIQVSNQLGIPPTTIAKWIRKFKQKRLDELEIIRKTNPELINYIISNPNKYPGFLQNKPKIVKKYKRVDTRNISSYTLSRKLKVCQEAINVGNINGTARKHFINDATLRSWMKKIDLLKEAVDNGRDTFHTFGNSSMDFENGNNFNNADGSNNEINIVAHPPVKEGGKHAYNEDEQSTIAYLASTSATITMVSKKYNISHAIIRQWIDKYNHRLIYDSKMKSQNLDIISKYDDESKRRIVIEASGENMPAKTAKKYGIDTRKLLRWMNMYKDKTHKRRKVVANEDSDLQEYSNLTNYQKMQIKLAKDRIEKPLISEDKYPIKKPFISNDDEDSDSDLLEYSNLTNSQKIQIEVLKDRLKKRLISNDCGKKLYKSS